MKRTCTKKKLFWIPVGIGIAAGVVFILMQLWNGLMPDIFGVTTINFWQAAGLTLMSKILFGIWGGGKRHACKNHRPDFMQHNMSEEDRYKFKKAFKSRFCQVKPEKDERMQKKAA